MTDFTATTDAEGIVTILWDVPGRSMNVLSLEGLAELAALIEGALADASVRGVVITSGKPDFAGGMDLNVIARMKAEAGAEEAAMEGIRHSCLPDFLAWRRPSHFGYRLYSLR